MQAFEEPKAFLREVTALDRPDTPKLLAALVTDPRFVQTNYTQLYMMIDLANAHRTSPLVDQMGSGRFWMTRYTDSDETRQMLRNRLRLEFAVGATPGPAAANIEAILRGIATHVPGVAIAAIRAEGNVVESFYVPADAVGGTKFMEITVGLYDSDGEAAQGLESRRRIVSTAPDRKTGSGDSVVFRWDQGDGHRILGRAGRAVVDVTGLDAQSEPVIAKAFASLVEQLGGL